MGVISLGYIGIETSQVDAWLSFAPDVLGLEVGTPGGEGEIPLRMDERPARLVLHPGPGEKISYIGWEVDDEASIRTIVEYALKEAGFEVTTAARGDEALEAVERDQVEDYARRKGWTIAEAERWLAPVLNYDPVVAARTAAE